MIRFTKILSGKITDKWLIWCGAGAQSHLGFLILLQTKYNTSSKIMYDEYIRHESIHVLQARELLVIFWYLGYGINFLIEFIPKLFTILFSKASYIDFKTFRVIIMNSFWESYRRIIFEVEAYDNDKNVDYLKTRKIFACFRKK